MANSLFGGTIILDVDADTSAAEKGLQQELDNLKSNKPKAMTAAVGQLHRVAQANTPVDKGRLKNSEFWEVMDGGDRGIVATNVFYSILVELGTRFMSARRFFGRTVDSEGANAMRTYRSILLGR